MKYSTLKTDSIENFVYKWRWTEEKYCLMPANDLLKIHPLDKSSSKKVWEKSLTFPNGEFEIVSGNTNFINTEIPESEKHTVLSWLEDKLLNGNIIVSWQPDAAVLTQTNIFIKYWEEFCYPSSDDVTVWPENEKWVLQYRHYEQFWFGEIKNV